MMKEIFDFLDSHPDLTIEDAVHLYFDGIIWSLEKDEFDRMTEEQRQAFYEALKRSTRRRSYTR
jgi:hypothetical protein